MILKYSSDDLRRDKTIIVKKSSDIIELTVPEMRQGTYKIFIECGNIKLKDYFSKTDLSINRSVNPLDSLNRQENEINIKYF